MDLPRGRGGPESLKQLESTKLERTRLSFETSTELSRLTQAALA